MLFRRYKLATTLFVLLTLVYLAQTFLTKPDPATLVKYHLTIEQVRLLDLTIAIPYIIIWFIALYGYMRLKTYHEIIREDKDGEAFRLIAFGVFWLGLFLPVSSLLTGVTTQYARNHHVAINPVRLANYINVVILFVAVWMIFQGSLKLAEFVKNKDRIALHGLYMVQNLTFIAFSAFYVMLVLHDPARRMPTGGVKVAGYYEPDWVLVLTVIIPRLLTWYLGFRACVNIYLYRAKVNGTLYRDALKRLAFGIGGALSSILFLRVLQTLSVTLNRTSLGGLLALIYFLLIVIAVGYVFIALGAKDMQKLEEI